MLKFNANGYKGKGNMTKLPSIPKRNPDLILEAKSYPNQSILYRLTGDTNPLHIDPKFAAIQKFPKPIIHGIYFHLFRVGNKWNHCKNSCWEFIGQWPYKIEKHPLQICRTRLPRRKLLDQCMEGKGTVPFFSQMQRKRNHCFNWSHVSQRSCKVMIL